MKLHDISLQLNMAVGRWSQIRVDRLRNKLIYLLPVATFKCLPCLNPEFAYRITKVKFQIHVDKSFYQSENGSFVAYR